MCFDSIQLWGNIFLFSSKFNSIDFFFVLGWAFSREILLQKYFGFGAWLLPTGVKKIMENKQKIEIFVFS